VKRRDALALLGLTPLLAARAQQPALPVIGLLDGWFQEGFDPYVAAFRQGLSETGYVEGKRVTIEYRWAQGDYNRLPALVADLIQRKAAVILTGATPVTRAAKAASTTVPTVFVIGADPIKVGLVASLNRPGGNVTGVSFLANSLLPKQFEVLHETLPKSASIGFLVNPINPNAAADTRDVQAAADALGEDCLSFKPGPIATLRQPSPRSFKMESARSALTSIRSSSPGHVNSSHLRRATRCLRFTRCVSSLSWSRLPRCRHMADECFW
jgi:putative ABC transport system substrate-binding protein